MSIAQRTFKTVFRIVFLGIVLYYLSRQLDIEETFKALGLVSFLPFAVGMVLMFCRYLLLGFRWCLSIEKPRPKLLWFLFREQHILFIEMVIPVPSIEDVLRVVLLKSVRVSWHKALLGTVRMRIAGVTVMAFLLLLFFVGVGGTVFGDVKSFQYATICVILLLLTPISPLVLRLGTRIAKRIPKIARNRVFQEVEKVAFDKNVSRRLPILVLIAIAQNCTQALVIFVLLKDLDTTVSFLHLVTLIPLLNLSLLLPISVQGYGLPEAAMVFLLPFMGVSTQIASSVAVLHLLLYTVQIGISAFIFFTTSRSSIRSTYRLVSNNLNSLKNRS